MKKIYDEAAIRAELKKLDEKTGLTGAKLPIKFNNAPKTISQYLENQQGFKFSKCFFSSPVLEENTAIEIIKLTYAKYMNEMIYGSRSFDYTWRQCCEKIRVIPFKDKDYDVSFRNKLFEDERVKEKSILKRIRRKRYRINTKIIHPIYGEGVITAITDKDDNKRATIYFEDKNIECRTTLRWMSFKCKKIS